VEQKKEFIKQLTKAIFFKLVSRDVSATGAVLSTVISTSPKIHLNPHFETIN